MLSDNDNGKGEAEVTIHHAAPREIHQHFLSACLFVCTHAAEEIRRTEQEEVYFNPDLINVRQAEGRKIKE